MASDDPVEEFMTLLAEATIYVTKVAVCEAVEKATNALSSLICRYVPPRIPVPISNSNPQSTACSRAEPWRLPLTHLVGALT